MNTHLAGIAGCSIVPLLQQAEPFLRLKQVDSFKSLLRIGGRILKHSYELFCNSLDGSPIEQIRGIPDVSADALRKAFRGTLLREGYGKIKPRLMHIHCFRSSLQAG